MNAWIAEKLAPYSDRAFPALRIGLGLMLLLAGAHQFAFPGRWAGYIAPQIGSILQTVGASGTLLSQSIGIVQVAIGALLVIDRYTVLAGAVATLALGAITFNLLIIEITGAGFTDILIRDIGLLFLAAGVTLAAVGKRAHDRQESAL